MQPRKVYSNIQNAAHVYATQPDKNMIKLDQLMTKTNFCNKILYLILMTILSNFKPTEYLNAFFSIFTAKKS